MKMTNRLMALAVVAASLATVACSSKDKAQQADSAQAPEVEEVAPVASDNALTALFNDESKASAVATDSTYATTASGLKYIIVREGEGPSPKAEDTVEVHYSGQLVDGTVFDSSYDRGEPTSFPLNRVIPGWTEGLQLMKEGGKAIFYIPSELAYGPQGVPGTIPANAPLIFTVELLKVVR